MGLDGAAKVAVRLHPELDAIVEGQAGLLAEVVDLAGDVADQPLQAQVVGDVVSRVTPSWSSPAGSA